MTETINRAEAYQVRDVAALEALPVGARLNSTNGPDTWFELFEDGWHYVWGNGEHVAKKGRRPSGIFFSGMSPARDTRAKVYRYLLNPEVLGEIRPA